MSLKNLKKNVIQNYKEIKMKKIQQLIETIDNYKTYPWFTELQFIEEKNYLRESEEDIKEFLPKVAVVGEFSSGKSTLINSFLGSELLPAKFEPTTKFNTKIEYAEEERIVVDGEDKKVQQEVLANIDQIQTNEINIYLNNPLLKKLSFIDTPGTNDPSSFTDEIVFSLIGEVDIVLFVISSINALKETEKQFLSKLIREKDIGKFFFVLNFADMVDNPRIVKKDFVDRLSSLLTLDSTLIAKHTFVYSAKEALNHRMHGVSDKRYEILSDSVISYLEFKKDQLIDDVLNNTINNVKNSILFKLETLEEKIAGKTNTYADELSRLDEEIKSFELAISQEQIEFQKDFNTIKNHYRNDISNSIKDVKADIKNEISNKEFKDLAGSRYIELRTKKLLEDRIAEDTEIFMNEMKQLVSDFDAKILSSKQVSSLQLKTLDNSNKSKTIVNIAAVATVAAGGVAVAPTAGAIITGGTIMAGLGSIAPALIAVPVVGPLLAGVAGVSAMAIPIIGTFALTAGKIMFDVGKWGVGKLGDGMASLELEAKKMAYANHVDKALTKIQQQLFEELNKINIETFNDQYITSKFPEKMQLEQKIEFIEQKQLNEVHIAKEELQEIENFKSSIRI